MNIVRTPFHAALAVSAVLHTGMLVAFGASGGKPFRSAASDPSPYVFLRLQPPPAGEPSPVRSPSARLTETAKSVSGMPAAEGSSAVPRAPGRASTAARPRGYPSAGGAGSERVVSSEELLGDPQKGKIFSRYFQSIKARIQTVATRHRQFIVRERGKVELDFVLNREGLLVSVEPRVSGAASPLVVSRALDIIHESEPFQRFPSEIPAKSISFNITLVFDG